MLNCAITKKSSRILNTFSGYLYALQECCSRTVVKEEHLSLSIHTEVSDRPCTELILNLYLTCTKIYLPNRKLLEELTLCFVPNYLHVKTLTNNTLLLYAMPCNTQKTQIRGHYVRVGSLVHILNIFCQEENMHSNICTFC